MENIFLIGFMGTGKSAVSDYLKETYQIDAVDTDILISERENLSIPGIFEKYGEAYFRQKESELLAELQEKKNTIVSCGGGIVLQEENIPKMKKSGKIILLTASAETILERVKDDDNRPLLKGHKNVEFIRELLAKRRDKYEAAADIVIQTDYKTIPEICMELMNKINPNKKRLILASASPRRSEILKQAGLDFEVMASHKEETYQSNIPSEIVKELSLLKAEDIAGQIERKNVTVIGADTVVAYQGQILGKPQDDEDAFSMIEKIQGDCHFVYTGFAIISYDKNGIKTSVNNAVETKVFLNPMDSKEILSYLAAKEHMDKAGSYAIQGRFAPYIRKIEGDYYNVVGLPISTIYPLIK